MVWGNNSAVCTLRRIERFIVMKLAVLHHKCYWFCVFS